MIGRVVLAVLLSGVAAGLVMGFIQHVRLTPLILEAEKYENAGGSDHATAGGDHGIPGPAAAQDTASEGASNQTAAAPPPETNATAAPPAEEETWAPEDGGERTFYTTAASVVTGAGFAALLAGISLLSGARITARNGVLWGLSGFLAFTLAPAAGLSPELPGMPAADLMSRQIWWAFTIAATGVAIYLIAFRREMWAIAAAVVLIAFPHIIGAPAPATHESVVPPGLSAEFAANVLAIGAISWCIVGTFLGLAMDRFVKEA